MNERRVVRRDTFLPFSRPHIGEEEIREVTECLRSGWITTGPRTERFEKDFAAYVGAKHAVALSSGTAALHCAYEAIGIGPGDEVILPSLTWPATASMAMVLGAVPVFADIDPVTWQIDPADVKRKITPRTKAIAPVHFAGAPCDLDALRALGLPLVEDAAHAVGTEYKGRRIGGDATAATFSFHPIKDITTGEGGMLTTDDDAIARRVRLFKFHGVDRDAWKAYGAGAKLGYDTVFPGFKYNLTDLQSAIGIHQLRRLDGFIARRTALAERYRRLLPPGLPRSVPPPYPHRHAWHLFQVLADDRDAAMERLKAANIGTGLHFVPLHQQTAFRRFAGPLPNTDAVGDRIVSLPLYPDMTDADADDVAAAVREVLT